MPSTFLFTNSRIRFAAALLATIGLAGLAGCVIAPLPPANPVVVDQGPVVVAPVAPPPLVIEDVRVAPAPGYIWITGFWSWSSGRHVWTRGYWAPPPQRGYRWVPRTWNQGPGGWHQHGGYWSR